jgi:hypothetical protein
MTFTSGVRRAPPVAGPLLESLRGLGYSTPTALADLIDNSISANARRVDITLHWAGSESIIRVLDDGDGMVDADLQAAMTLGKRDPRAPRDSGDLGRFGLGLKTASFSQARRLTVATRTRGGDICCLRWDLDLIEQGDGSEWDLYEGPAPGSEALLAPLLEMDSGTIVLWENLDRIVTDGFGVEDMIELADLVAGHLAMTFHRLMDTRPPGIQIYLNGKLIKPWDPFLTGEPGKALESPVFAIPLRPRVFVQSHVLPHQDMISEKTYQEAGGPLGWIQQQGFYVYRNRRLLLAGGWLGLGEGRRSWTRDEAHKLVRISVDLPNSSDADWKINVLKSSASPPVSFRPHLLRIALEARGRARKVFANRGHVFPTRSVHSSIEEDVWLSRRSAEGTTYKINRDHELVSSLLKQSAELAPHIKTLLGLIEETVPVAHIWLESSNTGGPPTPHTPPDSDDNITDVILSCLSIIVETLGIEPQVALTLLRNKPGLQRYRSLISKLDPTDATP